MKELKLIKLGLTLLQMQNDLTFVGYWVTVAVGTGRASLSMSNLLCSDVQRRNSSFLVCEVGTALTYHHTHVGPSGQLSGCGSMGGVGLHTCWTIWSWRREREREGTMRFAAVPPDHRTYPGKQRQCFQPSLAVLKHFNLQLSECSWSKNRTVTSLCEIVTTCTSTDQVNMLNSTSSYMYIHVH